MFQQPKSNTAKLSFEKLNFPPALGVNCERVEQLHGEGAQLVVGMATGARKGDGRLLVATHRRHQLVDRTLEQLCGDL